METWIRWAGFIQLVILCGNFFIPQRLRCREDIQKLSLINRQVFITHYVYILLVLGGFSLMCLLFPAQLAAGSTLSRFITTFLALFWGSRFLIQLFYYDPQFKRAHRAGNIVFILCFLFLALVFSTTRILSEGGHQQ